MLLIEPNKSIHRICMTMNIGEYDELNERTKKKNHFGTKCKYLVITLISFPKTNMKHLIRDLHNRFTRLL